LILDVNPNRGADFSDSFLGGRQVSGRADAGGRWQMSGHATAAYAGARQLRTGPAMLRRMTWNSSAQMDVSSAAEKMFLWSLN